MTDPPVPLAPAAPEVPPPSVVSPIAWGPALRMGAIVLGPATFAAIVASIFDLFLVSWFALGATCASLMELSSDAEPRRRLHCGIGLAVLAPGLYFLAWRAWQAPIYRAHGLPEVAASVAWVHSVVIAASASAGGLLAFVLAIFVVGRNRPRLARLPIAARIATMIACLLSLFALGQSARLPDSEGYVGRQPVIATVSLGDGDNAAPHWSTWKVVSQTMQETNYEIPLEDGARLVVHCSGPCVPGLKRSGSPRLVFGSGAEVDLAKLPAQWGVDRQVRHDRRNHLWILRSAQQPGGELIFRDDGTAAPDLSLANLGRGFSPPRTVSVIALIGSILAMVQLWRGRTREAHDRAESAYRSPADPMALREPWLVGAAHAVHALAIAATTVAPLVAWYVRVWV